MLALTYLHYLARKMNYFEPLARYLQNFIQKLKLQAIYFITETWVRPKRELESVK